MKKLLITMLFFCCNIRFSCNAAPNYITLDLLQVLCRHEERYPKKSERALVASDSYDYFFEHFEDYGQLTEMGKLHAYKFGRILRKMYGSWLGVFKNKKVYARSTAYNRTKMTLQLILAGLFPPRRGSFWSYALNWTPIPTHYYPVNNDLFRVLENPACDLGIEISPNMTERMKVYQDFYEKLKSKTNIDKFEPRTISKLYSYFRSLLVMGLPLPNWCSSEDYRKLKEIAKIGLESLNSTVTSRKAITGSFIELLLNNINENEQAKRKLYLYAAHGTNIASFLQAHNVTGLPSIPNYGSAIVIKSYRGDDGQKYIKMAFWDGVFCQFSPIKINGEKQLISLDKYSEIVSPMIPNDNEKSCYLPKQ